VLPVAPRVAFTVILDLGNAALMREWPFEGAAMRRWEALAVEMHPQIRNEFKRKCVIPEVR
jgi:hypothetical protein